ncbi:tRNA lysidine(34) synthetase TilS [Ferrimonas balearica]|uniref:tRNA lysidine(34) synthetase TilS n=1 Tax=Ferrimonas balearica TaxID=44012 RepID=UPI001C947DE0|nr:tRNA lysidine(34) synthetase TilS [Ferrimonas balearica]MBY6225002.1 tRNA lysidine(34) synthetase TilS [Ferrimonas balearica]
MSLTAPLARLEAALAEALKPHLATTARILLAYSGGVDSELLAVCLARWAGQCASPPVSLIHIHHGLSAYADQWAGHCAARAKALDLPIEVVTVQLQRGPRISIEASARQARYDAFRARLGPNDLLLTAHHLDDQAESLLLALKRGSGPRGLSAMAAQQTLGQGRMVRPWLGLRRAEIEAAAAQLGLEHIEDDSNADTRFDRNFLRHQVLPQLNQRWPGFSQAVVRSAALCAEQQQLCDELAEADLLTQQRDDGALSVTALAALSAPRRNNLLRFWLRQQGALMPSQLQMAAMAPLWEAREDAQPQLDWGEHSLRRFRDGLYLVTPQPALSVAQESLSLSAPTQLANGQCWRFIESDQGPRFRSPAPGQQVSVRYGLPGTLRLKPAGRSGSRPLKKLWQEQGVPPWLRGRVAMLCYDDEVVAALGYWLEAAALCEDGTGWVPQLAHE